MKGVIDVHVSETAPGVTPEAALAWWSDFHEGTVRHGRGRTRRRILERRSDGAVTMEDRAVGLPFRETVTARADPAAPAVRFEGENTVSRFEGEYAFDVAPGVGTRVTLRARVRLRRGVSPFAPLARPLARRLLAHDLKGHVEEMRRDLAR